MTKSIKRPSKEEDQDKAEEVFLLIKELVLLNTHIDMNQFAAACLSVWTDRCIASGLSHAEFREETMRAIDSAKEWWE